MLNTLKNISPSFLKDTARHVRAWAFLQADKRRPFLNKMRYCGFDLYYTCGAGLIERIRLGSTDRSYEPDLIQKITNELGATSQPILLDIGTNIGLISLALLKKDSRVKIYGFEPSPIPFKTFITTIFANQLEERVSLFPAALSDKSGFVNFSTHGGRDSSGDGMIDTMRSESTVENIKVPTVTLDEWWNEQKKPAVTHIKIDVEGAELLALKGGVTLLKECKPKIFLEISNENLKVYPHKASDVFSFLQSEGYNLENMQGVAVTMKSLEAELLVNDTFIATSKS